MAETKGTGLREAWAKRLKLRAESRRLWRKGDKLVVESHAIRDKSHDIWADAIAEAYGPNEPIDWSSYPDCIVRGERFSAETEDDDA